MGNVVKKLDIITALAATVAFVGSAQAAEFVQNGNFSNLTNGVGSLYHSSTVSPVTDAPPWTETGLGAVMANGNTGAPNADGSSITLWTNLTSTN